MDIILIVFFVIAALAIRLTMPTLLVRRALKPVILSLKKQGALSAETALPHDRLEILQKTGIARYTRMSMYRQKALEALLETAIVKSTDDGRLYLDTESLMSSRLVERWPELSRLATDKPADG
jgi:uncharacterized protein HemY